MHFGAATHAAAEGRLQQAAALVAEDAWLSWRLEALLALSRAASALVKGEADDALEAVGAARASLDGAEARVERVRLLLIEAQAEALLERPDAHARLSAALESARELDHPALIVDAAVALARHAPHAADEMKQIALAALAAHRGSRAARLEGRVRLESEGRGRRRHRNVNPRPANGLWIVCGSLTTPRGFTT